MFCFKRFDKTLTTVALSVCGHVGCSPVCKVAAAAAAAVSTAPPLPLGSGSSSGGGGLGGGGALLRQQASPTSQQVMAAVDGHAGVFDEQVLQWAAGQRHLLATAGEAGRGCDQPALRQAGGVQAEEALLFFLLVLGGVEGGARGIAQQGARGARGPGHHY